jgi:hypothetical protein
MKSSPQYQPITKQVDVYIEKQPSPQKEMLKTIRKLFRSTLRTSDEKIAWGVVTYLDNRFYLAAINDRVHIGFAIGGLSKEEISRFEGTGKTMRHIKIRSHEDIDEKKLVRLIKLVEKKAVRAEC